MTPSSPEQLEADLARYFAQAEPGCGRQSDLALHVAGELVGQPAEDFARHLATCAECTADLAELDQAREAWDAAVPAKVLRFPSRVRLFVGAAGALAAAVIALVALWVPDAHRLTAKGGWTLELAAERNGKQFLAPSGTVLQAGDSLGLFYSSDHDGYLTVLYADGHQAPVRLFPARSQDAARILAGNRISIPDGAVLSGGADCEWVIGFFSDRSLSAEQANRIATRMVEARRDCTLGPSADSQVEVRVITVRR